jgi:LEA14-like dessication related protein
MKEPVFNGIENVRINKLAAGKSLMTFEMSYFNPNSLHARLKEAEGEAWLDSTYLGHFYVDSSVNIPANSNFTLPVKLSVEMKNILRHSLAAFLNEQVLITIRGKARVGKSGIYRKFPLNYEGKQNLQELFK